MRPSQLTGRRRGTPPAAGPVGQPPGQSAGRPPRRPAGTTRPRSYRRLFDDKFLPVLLIAPAAIVVAGLVGYPILRTAWLSLHEAGLAAFRTGEMDFVGLGNYLEMVQDPTLRRSAIATILFGLACVAGTMLVGIAVALLLNRPFRGRTVLAVLVLLPWAMPQVAAATVWRWLFHDQYGIANWALSRIGFDQFDGYAWFIRWPTAFLVIGLVVVWQSFPFVAIALLAGLQTIPAEIVDAATVDGVSPWQRLRYITLPMLKPLLLVLLVISTIWDFKIFDQVYVMTGGGPARQTEILAISTYVEAFTRLNVGMGASLAMGMFVILLVFTLLYVRLIRDEERL